MFNSIEEAIEDIKKGKPIIIVDDEDRENEGDLVIPAQVITEETVSANNRRAEIQEKISIITGMLNYL